jgi:chromosome segregation ATPase
MPLEKIEIIGFRGFSSKQIVQFSIPNGALGSGLTIITGANNSGKSSIIECLKARGGYQSVDLQAKLIHCLHRILIRFTQPLWA